jgi:hypothetical protein
MNWQNTRRKFLFGSAAVLSNFREAVDSAFGQVQEKGSLGFTQVVPTAPYGQGRSFNGAGSRMIYVSYDTGSDSNPGTQASPMRTLKASSLFLRDGYPDQLLLRCGDTWPAIDRFINRRISGPSAGAIGKTCTGPILFSFYGSGARPIILVDRRSSIGFYTNGVARNNIAIIGIEFYSYARDYNNAFYSFYDAQVSSCAINLAAPTSWTLIEDCRFSFFGVTLILAGSAHNRHGTIAVRRCIFYHSYALGGGNSFTGHSQHVYMSYVTTPILEDNVIDYGGWDPTLITPATVTIIPGFPGTVMWPTTPRFGNGATIYVESSGGGLLAKSPYFVVDLNGRSFQLATTVGGTGVTISSGASTTMQWADPCSTIYNHNLYGGESCGPFICTGNISLNGNDLMVRSGGTITGNFSSYCNLGISIGAFVGCCGSRGGEPTITAVDMSGNVIQHANGRSTAPVFNTLQQTAGGAAGNLANAAGTGMSILVTNNIFSQQDSSDPSQAFAISDHTPGDCTGCYVINNIIFKWAGSVTQNPIHEGNTVTRNVFDQTGDNVEGYLAPYRDIISYDRDILGGPGTFADFESRAVNRALQTWPYNLTAASLIAYVAAGFSK